jgi:diamine N-acetyltransferase
MDHTLTLRAAQPHDAEQLSAFAMRCYAEAFGHSFAPEDLAAHLAQQLAPRRVTRMIEEDLVILAEVDRRLVGFVQCGAFHDPLAQPGDQELRRLYVHPEFQNRGYGSALVEAALRHPQLCSAKRIYLDVWEHNQGAQRFYRRYGFVVVGSRAFEVESGAATSRDLIMVRDNLPGKRVHAPG